MKHKIHYCQACGRPKKINYGKYHTNCSEIIYPLLRCKPENRPWVAHQLELKYGVKINLPDLKTRKAVP